MGRKRLAVKRDVPIQIMMTRDEIERIDAVCDALNLTRSDFIRVGIEHNFEDWGFLSTVGITPVRLNKFVQVLKKLGSEKDEDEG